MGTKNESNRKRKVEDVFNIVYDDLKPIYKTRKDGKCKIIEVLSKKIRNPTNKKQLHKQNTIFNSRNLRNRKKYDVMKF